MVSTWLAKPHEAFRSGFYENDEFDFGARLLLGQCAYGAADAGEVLATIARIPNDNHRAWFDEWMLLGERIRSVADQAAEADHLDSASCAYLRAATYYATAMGAIDGLTSQDQKKEDVILESFKLHRSSWDRFTETSVYPFERISIPYESTTMPGYFARPDDSGDPRPTIILNNGSDGSISSMWATGGLGGLQRGYNVLFFDGPGQQSMLFEHEVGFRPDWEAVITPIVDELSDRPDVDADRIALYGISQGGYWVPRALAFEHRIAAAIADPGVVDVSTSWLGNLPASLTRLIEAGERVKFDRDMGFGMRMSASNSRTWNFRGRPYRRDGYFDTLTEVMKYNLTDVAAQITTPILITDPEGEQFWPGQSQELFDLLPGVKDLVRFTADEGASGHCQPMARLLTDQRMFDWLDETLAGADGDDGEPAVDVEPQNG